MSVLVELHLDDLVETSNNCGKTIVHLPLNTINALGKTLLKSRHFFSQRTARIVTFFFDEPRKLLESVRPFLRLLSHAKHTTGFSKYFHLNAISPSAAFYW